MSSTTVSHVINRTRAVNAETAERVWSAVRDLDFVPSTLARNLRMKTTHTIGVVSDASGNPFVAEVVAGIEEVCFERHFGVFVSYSERDPDRETQAVRNLVRRGVAGLVWQPVQADAEVTALLAETRVPVAVFQRQLPLWNRDTLLTDDATGTRLVLEHLKSLGHRRIALVTGETFPSHSAGRRELVYREQTPDPLVADGNYTYEGAYDAARRMLALDDRPTALFCISDRMALGALAAAQDAGLSVPRDLSLVGYDNLELLTYVRPRLTTVDHAARDSGRRLAQQLLDRIANPDSGPVTLHAEPRLLVRDTTGPAPLR